MGLPEVATSEVVRVDRVTQNEGSWPRTTSEMARPLNVPSTRVGGGVSHFTLHISHLPEFRFPPPAFHLTSYVSLLQNSQNRARDQQTVTKEPRGVITFLPDPLGQNRNRGVLQEAHVLRLSPVAFQSAVPLYCHQCQILTAQPPFPSPSPCWPR
jgi:hypothetical protein